MLAGAALGALMFAAPAQAQDLEEINIMVPNNNTTTLFPVIVARNLGLFEKAGLKVNYLDSETSVPYVAFLSNSQADAVMLDAPQTLQAANAKQPVKVVYEAMQNAPEGLYVPEGGEVKTIADLKGKTIGLAGDRDRVTSEIVLQTAGMKGEDVSMVVVGTSGPVMAKALQENQVQAFSGAINDLTVVAAFGIKLTDLTPPEVKVNPANTFSVWGPREEELRPKLEKFFRVWAMATVAGKIDPETVARMCQKQVPEEWENKEAGQALMEASFSLNFPVTEKYGDIEPDVWKSIQPLYLKVGDIEAEIDPATFLDNSFIAAANSFTEDEVKAALEEWKAANP
jgi:NitT/TauT family transport system substrate-binding protein